MTFLAALVLHPRREGLGTLSPSAMSRVTRHWKVVPTQFVLLLSVIDTLAAVLARCHSVATRVPRGFLLDVNLNPCISSFSESTTKLPMILGVRDHLLRHSRLDDNDRHSTRPLE